MREEKGNGGITTGDKSSAMIVGRIFDVGEVVVVVVRKGGKGKKKISKKKNNKKRNGKCEFLLLEFTLNLLEFGRVFQKKGRERGG